LLRNDPYPRGFKKISTLKNVYRIRQGQYRILYRVDSDSRQIAILSVAHRRDAYRGL
jgi:mRNA interferase RelE/StbE